MKTKVLLIEDAMLNEVVGGVSIVPTSYGVSFNGKVIYSFTPKSSIDLGLLAKVDGFLSIFKINIIPLRPEEA